MMAAQLPKATRSRVWRCWLACGVVGCLAAAEPEPAAESPAAPVHVASLTFEDVSSAFSNWSLTVVQRTTPFEKEPELKSGDPFRGTFQGGSTDGDRVPFLWDRSASKLYVDLNRNLDLTDDAAGVFSGTGLAGPAYQVFNAVRLPLAFPTGTRSAAMELSLYGRPPGLFAYAGLRSLWLGQVTLDGREWQVGLFDDPFERRPNGANRRLLLRPWAERDKPFQMYDGGSPLFAMPTNLFLNGRGYGLTASTAGTGDKDGINLAFTERQTVLGELKLTGQHIERLALNGGVWLALLEQPAPGVRIPVDRYHDGSVRLRMGNVEAVRDRRPSGGGVTVSETGAATLEVGGPLTNSVSVSRRGRTLVLNYQLLGARGETYQLVQQGVRKPPEFAAYQGETKITSGRFEFG